MRNALLAGFAAVALSAGAAQAALLEITGGTPYITPANNDFSVGWAGRANATAPLTVSTTAANVTLTYTFLFKEAGFEDTFTTAFGSISNNDPLLTSVGGLQAAIGALNFSFTTPLPGGPFTNSNGEAAGVFGGDTFGFFATTNAPGIGTPVGDGATGDTIWLAFDDGGANTDDNHDDMIIRIDASVAAVPEPATLGLLGAGLLGLGFAARRRKAS